MAKNEIYLWQQTLKAIDPAIDLDGDFGPQTLALSLKAAEKAGIIDNKNKITGLDFLALAATKIGQRYVYGANVDLNNPSWPGPWDCAEFISWLAKQLTGKTIGCVDNNATDPDPYTGGWKKDLLRGDLIQISIEKAARTQGAILLRFRENGKHIVLSAGDGGTIEAKGAAFGVCRGTIGSYTSWDYAMLIPGVDY